MLLELASLLSLTPVAKTQCFVHLSFDSTFQLSNGISSDLQKLLRLFNGTVIDAVFRTSFAATALPINVSFMKDLKSLIFSIQY